MILTFKWSDKIIAITRWEIPILIKLGVKKEKIAYIPNGIPDEFFKQKKVINIYYRDMADSYRVQRLSSGELIVEPIKATFTQFGY